MTKFFRFAHLRPSMCRWPVWSQHGTTFHSSHHCSRATARLVLVVGERGSTPPAWRSGACQPCGVIAEHLCWYRPVSLLAVEQPRSWEHVASMVETPRRRQPRSCCRSMGKSICMGTRRAAPIASPAAAPRPGATATRFPNSHTRQNRAIPLVVRPTPGPPRSTPPLAPPRWTCPSLREGAVGCAKLRNIEPTAIRRRIPKPCSTTSDVNWTMSSMCSDTLSTSVGSLQPNLSKSSKKFFSSTRASSRGSIPSSAALLMILSSISVTPMAKSIVAPPTVSAARRTRSNVT